MLHYGKYPTSKGIKMNLSKKLCLALLLISAISLFAQPFVIEEYNVRGRGGRATHYRPASPSSPTDDWWYSDLVECVSDVGCVDIVFVVDTSGSMSGTVAELADEIDRFAYD